MFGLKFIIWKQRPAWKQFNLNYKFEYYFASFLSILYSLLMFALKSANVNLKILKKKIKTD